MGDELQSINGQDVVGLPYDDVKKLVASAPKLQFRVIRRGGSSSQISSRVPSMTQPVNSTSQTGNKFFPLERSVGIFAVLVAKPETSLQSSSVPPSDLVLSASPLATQPDRPNSSKAGNDSFAMTFGCVDLWSSVEPGPPFQLPASVESDCTF